jgi:tetratricopeptide (TPR) repeat protein
VAVGLTLLACRRRGPLAAFLIFAGTLFPVLGFLNVYPFRFSWVADHFQYLASLGLIIPLAAALAMLPRAVPLGLLALLGACTWAQSGTYRDAETLYRATLARYPESFLAHHNLGDLLEPLPGRLDDAIEEYQAAVRIAPDFEKSRCNLGHALLQAGRLPEAVSELQIALRIKPNYAQAHNNLGSAWAQIPGRLPDAITEFQAALRTDPDFAEAHFNLGNAYAQIPRLPDAVTEFQAAIWIDPGDVAAHTNLGGVLAQLPGHMEDAIGELQTAVRLAPGRAEGHYNLGSALAQVPGRTSDAIAEFEAALRIRPDFEPAREGLEELRKMSR